MTPVCINSPLKVLCLDIEGGYGGSSRSLFELLRHMDRAQVQLEVWCKKDGPSRRRYEALGIPCRIEPQLPKMNSLPRLSRNLFGYLFLIREFLGWGGRHRLADALASDQFDLVHFNHEGLHSLASWMRGKHSKAQTMHIRTMIPVNGFGRWQCRRISGSTDHLAFITENEWENFKTMVPGSLKGTVIYNVAEVMDKPPDPYPQIPADGRLRVAVLSNFAWVRGTDRIIEIAETLRSRGCSRVLFVVAGDMALKGSLPGDLGQFAREGRTLEDYAESRGLSDMFRFLGHVDEPERVLSGTEVLIKPTRENNPWGRDILEALAAGKPVISIGHYDRFVKTGETGHLLSKYSSHAVADILVKLSENPGEISRMGREARKKITLLCSGKQRSADLLSVWQAAVSERALA